MTGAVRVALVGDFPLDLANAPGSRFLWLGKALAARGFDVVVGGLEGTGGEGAEGPGVATVTLPDRRPRGFLGRFWRRHRIALTLLANSALRGADAYWVRGVFVALAFAVFGRLTGRRVLWDFHGYTYMEQLGSPRLLRRLEARYYQLAERLTLALVHEAVAAGEGHRDVFRRVAPERPPCRTLANGVAVERFERPRDPARGGALREAAGVPPGAPVVGFVGNSLFYLAGEAFEQVAAGLPEAAVVVLGIDPEAAAVQPPKARYLGPRPNAEVADWLCDVFDVALCPYRHDWVHAGLPNFFSSRKVMEYAAAGLPIVVPDIPGRAAFLVPGEHCVLYRPTDPDDLVAQVRALLADPEARARMGKANRALARGFAWDRMLDASGVVEGLRSAGGGAR